MWASFIALIVFLLFVVGMAWLFIGDLIWVGVNATIIYIIGLKAYADITKRDMLRYYLAAVIISAPIAYLLRGVVPLWWPTQIVVYTIILVKMNQYLIKIKL